MYLRQALASASILLLALCLVLVAGGALAGPAPLQKISPEILLHQEWKVRPPGVSPEDHAASLRELGLDPANLEAEHCAVYVAERLWSGEIEALEHEGIAFHPSLWIPPVPGRHPYGFHLANVPYAKLGLLRDDPRVVRVESTEHAAEPCNNLARGMTRVEDVHDGNGVTPRDGTGVKLAVADTGVDLSHPDLPTPVEKYDMTDGTSPASWGTNVSNTVTDHGTHVTGIAVASGLLSSANTGNGGGSFKGSAPGASLHFYKIGDDVSGAASFADMIEAVDRASAVGCQAFSMTHGGFSDTFMDGSGSVCQAIDAAVAGGMAVFVSAGNKGDLRHHASARAPAGGSSEVFTFQIANGGGTTLFGQTLLRVIWRDGNPGDANVTLAILNLSSGESLTPVASSSSLRGTDSRDYALFYNVPAGQSHDFQMTFTNAASSGLTPLVHIQRISGRGLFAADTDRFYTVIHPALCDGAIAVGAWTQRDEWVNYKNQTWQCCNLVENTFAEFSSRGPRVDGVRKPEVVAPGATTISTRDATFSTLDSRIIDNDGAGLDGSGPANYYGLHGTSMSAPMAAGAAALVIEADPSLAASGVRNALTRTATRAATPDDTVGYGLIDALAAVASVPGAGEDLDGDWYPESGLEGSDCDDADSENWLRPGEATALWMIDRVTLEWGVPVEPGASSIAYDVLRSTSRADFGPGAVCVEGGDGGDRQAFDPALPASGQAFYYLVRAVNGCPGSAGQGTLGSASSGAERTGRSCS
jgi:subtilisin family serine protease